MNSKSLLLLVALVQLATAAEEPRPVYKDCGGSLVTFNSLLLEPVPLVITRTSHHFLSTNLTIKEDLPADAELHLVVNKTLVVGTTKTQLTLPCLDGIGSCTLKFCDLFTGKFADQVCPFFKANNQACACPVKAGTFASKHIEVKIPLDNFKGIAPATANGDYSVRLTITDHANTKTYACLDISTHLVLNATA